MDFALVRPTLERLPRYVDALKRGWSPSTHEDNSAEELQRIERDPVWFIALQEDREARGDPVRLDDGSFVPRLPGFRRWMWDGDFAGIISLRWQPGKTELPQWCSGHIGYSVVSWKRRRHYATEALRLMLHEARREELSHVQITTSVGNIASQRVITANGGKFIEQFNSGPAQGNWEMLRYRIDL